MSTLQKKL